MTTFKVFPLFPFNKTIYLILFGYSIFYLLHILIFNFLFFSRCYYLTQSLFIKTSLRFLMLKIRFYKENKRLVLDGKIGRNRFTL